MCTPKENGRSLHSFLSGMGRTAGSCWRGLKRARRAGGVFGSVAAKATRNQRAQKIGATHWLLNGQDDGTKWQNVNEDNRKTYLANAYRVLLARARQGMVIYIPDGNAIDATRPPAFCDGTADLLAGCGLSFL